ncbi:MAG: hypothetical protein LBO73_03935, partial [Holosporaceae bacterium]|nr:hypothetical protein [Holosporaceae bacterium]
MAKKKLLSFIAIYIGCVIYAKDNFDFESIKKLEAQIEQIPPGKGCKDGCGSKILKIEKESNAENGILVFVSFSMPDISLKELDETAKAVFEIHRERGMYKFDKNDPLISKSEEYHKNPQKLLNEIETRTAVGNDYTVEYCEECSGDEYLVTARKTKKRYVYLQTPPYITAGQNCDRHGWLSVKVEILNEPEEVFREDGQFLNIRHVSTNQWGGAHIDEVYNVNGVDVVLRKTIFQDGLPWIRPGCYLIPSLRGNVVNSGMLITKLLGGANDEDIGWGEIGNAHLYHRTVNDTGEHYWILDDKCKEYEKLTEEGLCRYHSMVEDPPSDKYWKGKK